MNLIFGTLVMPQPLVHRGEEKRANFFFEFKGRSTTRTYKKENAGAYREESNLNPIPQLHKWPRSQS